MEKSYKSNIRNQPRKNENPRQRRGANGQRSGQPHKMRAMGDLPSQPRQVTRGRRPQRRDSPSPPSKVEEIDSTSEASSSDSAPKDAVVTNLELTIKELKERNSKLELASATGPSMKDLSQWAKALKVTVSASDLSTLGILINLGVPVLALAKKPVIKHPISHALRNYMFYYFLQIVGVGQLKMNVLDVYGSSRNNLSVKAEPRGHYQMSDKKIVPFSDVAELIVTNGGGLVDFPGERRSNRKPILANAKFNSVFIQDVYHLDVDLIRRLIDSSFESCVYISGRFFVGECGWDKYGEGAWIRDSNGLIVFRSDDNAMAYPAHPDINWLQQRVWNDFAIDDIISVGDYFLKRVRLAGPDHVAAQVPLEPVNEYKRIHTPGIMGVVERILEPIWPTKPTMVLVNNPIAHTLASKYSLFVAQRQTVTGALTAVQSALSSDSGYNSFVTLFPSKADALMRGTWEYVLYGKRETVVNMLFDNRRRFNVNESFLLNSYAPSPPGFGFFSYVKRALISIGPFLIANMVDAGATVQVATLCAVPAIWRVTGLRADLFSKVRDFGEKYGVWNFVNKAKTTLVSQFEELELRNFSQQDTWTRLPPTPFDSFKTRVTQCFSQLPKLWAACKGKIAEIWAKTKPIAVRQIQRCVAIVKRTNDRPVKADIIDAFQRLGRVVFEEGAKNWFPIALPVLELIVSLPTSGLTSFVPFSFHLALYILFMRRLKHANSLFCGLFIVRVVLHFMYNSWVDRHSVWEHYKQEWEECRLADVPIGLHDCGTTLNGWQCPLVVLKHQIVPAKNFPSLNPIGDTPYYCGSYKITYQGSHLTYGQALDRLMPPVDKSPRIWLLLYPSANLPCPAKSDYNLLVALLERNIKVPFSNIKCSSVLENWKWLYDTHTGFWMDGAYSDVIEPYPIEEVARNMPSRKAQRFLQAANQYAEGRMTKYSTSVMLKLDETICGSKSIQGALELGIKPRIISNVATIWHVLFAGYIQAFFDDWKKVFDGTYVRYWVPPIDRLKAQRALPPVRIIIGSGRTQSQLSEYAQIFEAAQLNGEAVIMASGDDSLCYFPGNGFLEGDFKQCDQCQGEGPTELFLAHLELMGMPPELVRELYNTLRSPLKYRNDKNDFELELDAYPQLRTGSTVTTMMNTFTNIALWYAYVIQNHERVTTDTVSQFFLLFGFNIKVKLLDDLRRCTFLKGWWVDTDAGLVWLPLPSQVLKAGKVMNDPVEIAKYKDGNGNLIRLSPRESLRRVCYALAKSYGKIPENYPIFGTLLKQYKYLGVESDLVLQLESHKIHADMDLKYLRDQHIELVCTRYNVSVQEIQECESLIESVTQLPIMISHPAFAALLDVDYA